MSLGRIVFELHTAGLSGREIAKRVGVTPPTVSYHLRRQGVPPQHQGRYDWPEVQAYYDAGHSIRGCITRFGFSSATWHDAVKRGAVRSRPPGMPVDQLLTGRRQRGHVKKRLIRLGLKEDRCEECGIANWRDRPLSLALHHVNGDGTDNRLENLQLLCPNCHSQTENFAGRNRKRRPLPAEDAA